MSITATAAPAGRRLRLAALVALSVLLLAALWLQGPIPQDPAYHRFADARALLGIANFWNVASNLPFLAFGAWGLARVLRGPLDPLAQAQRPAWVVFFAGATLVAFGSGYYHLAPSNAALVWDRLPMTLAFMAFFALMLGEHLDLRLGRRALVPMLLLGLASVWLWHAGEQRGHGDLRLYAAVQFLPVLLVPALLVLFPRPRQGWLWGVFAAYALAKGLETLDAPIHAALGGMGGHALKHVAAAPGIACMLRWLTVRREAATAAG
jgi:hypothetical protein